MLHSTETQISIHFATGSEQVALRIFRVIRSTYPEDVQEQVELTYGTSGTGSVTVDLPLVSQEQIEMLQALHMLLTNIRYIGFVCNTCLHSEEIENERQKVEMHVCLPEQICIRCKQPYQPSTEGTLKCLPCILLTGVENHRFSKVAVKASLMAKAITE